MSTWETLNRRDGQTNAVTRALRRILRQARALARSDEAHRLAEARPVMPDMGWIEFMQERCLGHAINQQWMWRRVGPNGIFITMWRPL